MPAPKWARDRRRQRKQFERTPMRWVLGTENVPNTITPGRLWHIPEPMTITPPRTPRGGVSRFRRKNR